MAMLAAIAYLVMVVGRIPISSMSFLKYDPKDVVITIGGFILGPLEAFVISVIVSVIEMFTVSESGIIGAVMNVLSTAAFACTAAVIYKKDRTLKGAVIGLLSGVVCMTGIMLLWNYFITPIYMGYPREAVAALLIPVFLPFNLIKAGLNAELDGQAGIQQLAGDATMLYYFLDEAQEGGRAFLEKRKPDFDQYPQIP